MSYFYFGLVGMTVTTVVALLVSFATGANKLADADPDLFSPPVAALLPKRRQGAQMREAADAAMVPLDEYKTVPTSG